MKRRTETLLLTMSKTEKENLKRLAELNELSMSEYIRLKCLGGVKLKNG